MNNKRYQIFISSTYTDLKEERAEVTQAILSINHMPYGMEVFPSANETQWEYIKKVIKESDYYVVIIGGKYGSVNPKTGISYTEMEYRYAEEIKIPLLAFIVDSSIDLPGSKIESDPIKRQKLNDFKDYIESRQMRKSYRNKEDLALKIITSLNHLFVQHPRNGWIRSDSLKDYTSNSEVIKLMKDNSELKNKIESQNIFQQGEDLYNIQYELEIYEKSYNRHLHLPIETQKGNIELKWNEIFLLITEGLYSNYSLTTDNIFSSIKSHIIDIVYPFKDLEKSLFLRLPSEIEEDILIQSEAIGYIKKNSYDWSLTPKGRKFYVTKRALKK